MSVTLTQTESAAFPDRPDTGGQGLRVDLAGGLAGQYLACDVGGNQPVYHVRVMINPNDASGGTLTILSGQNAAESEMFRVRFDANARRIDVLLATGDQLAADLLASLDWHCVELGIDTTTDAATLWINGIEADTLAAPMGSLATRTFRIGGMDPDASLAGSLTLDEWITSTRYIGPVVIDPKLDHAGDPRRWVVLYNTADVDSVAWADHYRQKRGVPYANLIGLSLSTDETMLLSQTLALRADVAAYLDRHAMRDRVRGILVGYGVPGAVQFDPPFSVVALSVAGYLSDLDDDTIALPSPDYLDGVVGIDDLPARSSLGAGRRYLVAEINAPTRDTAEALSDRADALMTVGPDGRTRSALDPTVDQFTASQSHSIWVKLHAFIDTLEYQRVRLPARSDWDPVTEGHGHAVELSDHYLGAMVDTGQHTALFVAGHGLTAKNVRSGSALVRLALDHGYAFAFGYVSSVSPNTLMNPAALLAALRAGWTWAEAVIVSVDLIHANWRPIGDPLSPLPLPEAGWDVFGPFESWQHADLSDPSVALHVEQTTATLPAAHAPPDGRASLYVVRHIDDLGRAEAGLAHTRVYRSGDALLSPPVRPAFPSAPDWTAQQNSGQWRITAVWPGRFAAMNVERIDLVEQPLGESEQVVDSTMVDARRWQAVFTRPPGSDTVRYRIHAISTDGVTAATPWSDWMTLRVDETRPVVLI